MERRTGSFSPVQGGHHGHLGILEAPGGRKTQSDWGDPSDSPTFRNQSPPSAIVVSDQEVDVQRKEYYSKGRYLRCSPHPELEEDPEDEPQQQASESWAGLA